MIFYYNAADINSKKKVDLKILKGFSDANVNQRTDNIMTTGKRLKEQTIIYKTLHIILKITKHESHTKP